MPYPLHFEFLHNKRAAPVDDTNDGNNNSTGDPVVTPDNGASTTSTPTPTPTASPATQTPTSTTPTPTQTSSQSSSQVTTPSASQSSTPTQTTSQILSQQASSTTPTTTVQTSSTVNINVPTTMINVLSTVPPTITNNNPTTQSLIPLPSIRQYTTTGSDGHIYTVTNLVSGAYPTSNASTSGSNAFFQHKGAVAATFILAGLAGTAVLLLGIMTCIRRRKAQLFDQEVARTAADAARTTRQPSFHNDNAGYPQMTQAKPRGYSSSFAPAASAAYGQGVGVAATAGIPAYTAA